MSRSGDPLRVIIGADTFPPDVNGAARFTQRLAYGLAARGHEVHVLCPAADRRLARPAVPGVVVHRLALYPVPVHPTFRVCWARQLARRVAELMASIRPDVVHVQSHFAVGRTVIDAAVPEGVAVVATNHFMPENLLPYLKAPARVRAAIGQRAWRDLCRIFACADVVTTPTPFAATMLRQRGFAGEVLPISCGIDASRYRSERTNGDAMILFVGRLDPEKHADELLRALPLLPPRLQARVELVGDGRCRDALRTLANSLGIADSVRFHGLAPEAALLDAYARCAVFCMPGTAELQSIATMEAMATGRPVVAADAGALPHLVRPGENGWRYPPGNVAALADRLTRVLDQAAAARGRMGAASRRIIAGHDLDATLDRFEELYRRYAVVPLAAA
jgi:glycosyltransferase involved in cell wall biosynthesis